MAMCNGFSVCSDFIVVVMTTVRYAKYRINCECEAYFGRTQTSNDSLSACGKKQKKTILKLQWKEYDDFSSNQIVE